MNLILKGLPPALFKYVASLFNLIHSFVCYLAYQFFIYDAEIVRGMLKLDQLVISVVKTRHGWPASAIF